MKRPLIVLNNPNSEKETLLLLKSVFTEAVINRMLSENRVKSDV